MKLMSPLSEKEKGDRRHTAKDGEHFFRARDTTKTKSKQQQQNKVSKETTNPSIKHHIEGVDVCSAVCEHLEKHSTGAVSVGSGAPLPMLALADFLSSTVLKKVL